MPQGGFHTAVTVDRVKGMNGSGALVAVASTSDSIHIYNSGTEITPSVADHELTIFPNPAHEAVMLTAKIPVMNLEWIDITGKLFRKDFFNGEKNLRLRKSLGFRFAA